MLKTVTEESLHNCKTYKKLIPLMIRLWDLYIFWMKNDYTFIKQKWSNCRLIFIGIKWVTEKLNSYFAESSSNKCGCKAGLSQSNFKIWSAFDFLSFSSNFTGGIEVVLYSGMLPTALEKPLEDCLDKLGRSLSWKIREKV